MAHTVAVARVKEDARRCQRCQYQWFAVRVSLPSKPRFADETSIWNRHSAAHMARLQGNYTRAKQDHDRWAICPRCGSVKVKTVSDRGFVPTAAQGSAPPSQPTQEMPSKRTLRMQLDTAAPTALGSTENPRPAGRDDLSRQDRPRDCTVGPATVCECSAVLPPGARFCMNCGRPTAEPTPSLELFSASGQPEGADFGDSDAPPREDTPLAAYKRDLARAKAEGDREGVRRIKAAERERTARLGFREVMREIREDAAREQRHNG